MSEISVMHIYMQFSRSSLVFQSSFHNDVSRIIAKYSLHIVHKDIYDNTYSNKSIKLF